MPNPTKTGKKLERRHNWRLERSAIDPATKAAYTTQSESANEIIDTACEVLNDVERDAVMMAIHDSAAKLRAALTEANCIQEVERERFCAKCISVDRWVAYDRKGRVGSAFYITEATARAAAYYMNQLAGER